MLFRICCGANVETRYLPIVDGIGRLHVEADGHHWGSVEGVRVKASFHVDRFRE
jgi:hypothetical protein